MDKHIYNDYDNYDNYQDQDHHNHNYHNQSNYMIDSEFPLPAYLILFMLALSCTTSCYKLCIGCIEDCRQSRKKKQVLKSRRINSNDEENLLNECTVCLEKYKKNEKIIVLPCNHNFHEACIKEWFEKDNRSCPNCRENII
tara:strand:- start:140 stop:562 length:423 start_codon:yes stop_codon:yes gene_type:complete